MNILLVAINAKYSHTNLAVRDLQNVLAAEGMEAGIAEYTINQPTREILSDLARRGADTYCFSCYIWNIEYVRRLGADLRLLFPEASILLGGPEVSFDPEERLAAMPWADAILCGEGEPQIAGVLREGRPRGVRRAGRFTDLDALPFPYRDFDALKDRVLYYESSRGCPFGCSYCLSSADRTVRYRSLPRVFDDLRRFLDAGVMQVKFVDRTFNLDADRALAIWKFLAEHDNGITGFQMELGGDLLTGEQLAFLSTVRPGLFQFEIGVQSTCGETLAEVCRKTDVGRLMENVRALSAAGRLHLHLDLIAGLPGEDFARFAKSYDEVFSLRPEQLQLGFLKLLRGSSLYARREEYGLVHSETPPYEILCTPRLSFLELSRLKSVEEMTEAYYNSGRFSHTLAYLLEYIPSPFEAMRSLGERMPARAVGKYEYYDLLYALCVDRGGDPEICRWLVRYDLCLHERPRRLPACCPEAPREARRRAAEQGLPSGAHPELFPFDVTSPGREPGETAVCFFHGERDLRGRARAERIL